MKKNTYIIILVILASVILIGYGFINKNITTKEPIKIGATLALSGDYAYIGEAEKNGLEMAITEINLAGGINGRKLILISEDNNGDAESAVNSVIKLLNADNVDVLFSAFTHVTQSIKGLVSEKGKILLYASTLRSIAEENKLFFRDYFDASDHGRVAAKLVNKFGHKNLDFITEQSEQCIEFEDAFIKEGQKYGLSIIKKESYIKSEKDLRTLLLKLRNKRTDAILACSWRHEHLLMKQLKELGMIKKQVFHWIAPYLPVSDTPEMRELFSLNQSVSTWYGFPEDFQNEQQAKFIKKYSDKYKKKPIPDAAYAYDDIYILSEAIKNCNSRDIIDAQCVSQNLLKTTYNGAGGKITFDLNGVSSRDVVSVMAENGLWKEIKIEP